MEAVVAFPKRSTVDELTYQAEAVTLLRKVADAETGRNLAWAEMKRLREKARRQAVTLGAVTPELDLELRTETKLFRNWTMRRLRALRKAIEWEERQP